MCIKTVAQIDQDNWLNLIQNISARRSISQKELAEILHIGLRTLVDFEKGQIYVKGIPCDYYY